ncbi:DUF2339 domain-containing protein [Azonexus sp.]|jgi:uncharacterized membrane protein|uniref:DUF2339 domain-containing protein n=1 Tax=Azonexus sp. TaxID=1872668 RepID=UPI00281FAC09|nr:DUF2339 domain-containing protein [Azonexus sp.]MDR1994385.1 DUF2339 domain-containing protein [Azonexus sp.]
MLIWGAVWGGILGLLWPGYHHEETILIGALLGLAAGWTLRNVVRALVRKEIEAARTPAPPPVAAHAAAPVPEEDAVKTEVDDAMLDALLRLADDTPPASEPAVAAPPKAAAQPVASQAAKLQPATAQRPAVQSPAARPPAPPTELDQALVAVRQWFVQGNPIVRAGLVILFIGLSFLARYAAQAGLFPVELRLAAIGAVGIALLTVGFRQRQAKPAFGLVLQGGGVAVLYLTVFAAFRLYQLMPQGAAFAFMVLVCAASCLLALLQNARSLAFAAFAGGFATPLLLSTGGGSHVALFSYYTLLNLAILFIATRRAWRELNLLGFVATFGVAGAWGWMRYDVEHYASAQAFLIVFIAIFIATAILYARATPLRLGIGTGEGLPRTVDSTLVFGTPLAGFGLQAGLVQPFLYGQAFSALAFGAVYLALAALLLRRGGTGYRLLTECFLALGVGFVTLTVPLALDAQWVSAVWALEGAAAFWVGMRQARWMPRAFGLLLQALALLYFFGGLENPPVGRWPLAHAGFLGAALIALPALATAWWTRQPLAHSGSRWARGWAALEVTLSTPLLLYGVLMWLLAWMLECTRLLPALMQGEPLEPAWPLTWGLWLLTGVTLLSCAALLQWALRARWTAAAWPSRLTLPVLLLALLSQWSTFAWSEGWHVIDWPAWLCWPLALALHVWLLHRNEKVGKELLTPHWRDWIGWQHTGTVWLAVLLIGDALTGWIDRGDLWGTAWASVTGVVATMAILLALTFWAGRANHAETRTRLSWPLNPHAEAYYWNAAIPLALLLWLGAFALAWTSSGRTEPLPYIPLLNPTDLALLLALGTLLLWRGMALAAEPRPASAQWLGRPAFWGAIGVLALVALSTAWLRVAHHFFQVPWDAEDLYDSFVVQTGYAILWTLLALALMVSAHRRGRRPAWLAGAALLALVVVKLMLVDLSNRGGGERIVAFIGVGLLMLVVGYFAPLPPKAQATPVRTMKENP